LRLLDQQVAIITGSTKGNGRAMAMLFAKHGANTVITGRSEQEVKSVENEIRIENQTDPAGFVVDVSSLEQVQNLFSHAMEKYKRLDILVNNAGYPIRDDFWDVPFDEISDQDLIEVLQVDTLGTLRCCREAIPIMVKQHHGTIINISSTPAISGYVKGAPYTVAKAANLGITKHIAAEYGKHNIRCNAIAPGTIATQRNWDRLSVQEKLQLIASIPIGRAGRPDDVAGAALMLACDFCSFITGQTIVVDGGETIR